MNILLVNTIDSGGAAKACIRLHKGLLKAGISSKILFLKQSDSEIEASYKLYGDRKMFSQLKDAQHKLYGSRNHKVKKLPKSGGLFTFPHSSHRLSQHPLIKWADVVNLHWVSQLINYSTFFKKVKKPVVWTLHDMNAFSGGYHFKTGFPVDAYRQLIKANLNAKKTALKQVEKLQVVTPSEWLGKVSQNSEVFKGFPHAVIPNGIDTSIFRPYDKSFARNVFGLPTDKKVILFVAHATSDKRKGIAYLQKAFEQHLPDNVALAVLGGKTQDLNLSNQIYKLGKIHDERLMALAYSAADLFVIPSLEDNLPNTVVESICCGTPAVGFEIGGVPDMVKNELNGFLVKEINAEALARNILKALDFPFDKKTIREDAVNRFDDALQAKNYTALFQQLIA